MDLFQLLVVFGVGALELWAAIPIGLAFNFSPAIIVAVSSAGSILGALLVILTGEKIRAKLIKWRYGDKKNLKTGRFYNVWNKYGIVGLGLLSPLLFGALIGAAVGSLFGAERRRLLLWMSIGIIIWSTGLTIAGTAGLASIQSLWN